MAGRPPKPIPLSVVREMPAEPHIRPPLAYPEYPPQLTDASQEHNRRLYRALVGLDGANTEITQVQGRYLWFGKGKPLGAPGTYKLVCDEACKANVVYSSTSWFANVLLGLQIALAASITALGGSTTANKALAIVVLGAINTVVAAVLAFLKARGLPGSAAQYRDRLLKQKLEIESVALKFEDGLAAKEEGIDPRKAADKAKSDFTNAKSGFDEQLSTILSGRMPEDGKGDANDEKPVKENGTEQEPAHAKTGAAGILRKKKVTDEEKAG